MKRVPSVGSQSAFSSTNVYLCSACTPKILIPTGHTKSKWDKEKQHVTRLTSLCKYIAEQEFRDRKKTKLSNGRKGQDIECTRPEGIRSIEEEDSISDNAI